ncbi:hypothetical protein DsansV1_C29g0206841 [Dioscorea sansibarensis]
MVGIHLVIHGKIPTLDYLYEKKKNAYIDSNLLYTRCCKLKAETTFEAEIQAIIQGRACARDLKLPCFH